jgi:two-component system sensor histidine kinase BaeS
MRIFGCLFAIMSFFVVSTIVVLIATVISSLGLFGPGPPHLGLLALLVLGLLLAASAASGGLWRAGRTLDRLVEAARAVEAGDYTARVAPPVRGPRAVAELARAFDTMAGRLEADEAERRSLLADVSHELRTPLAVIRGSLEAIVDGVHPADEAHLAAIVEETRVMERLVEDLRTLALAEGGTLPLHREPTDIADLAHDVVASFQSTAAAAGVTLTADAPDDLPLTTADPVRIREVLANLVANAVRHTPSGGRVTVSAAAESGGIVVRVADTGSGIDRALLPHVFERFVKTAGSGGSGLGLAIARNLVVTHGGTIDVDSEPGAGATFTVRLPIGERDARGSRLAEGGR